MLLARSDERTLFAGWAIDPEPGEHPIARLSWTEARVAVRSFFPRRFWAAVRQKTRWVIGITLQGWRHLGWHGDPYQRYMLARDRKALIGNIVSFLGYVLVALVLLVWYANWVGNGNAQIPEIVREGSWVWYVLIINLWIVIYRLVVRAICTYQIYGLAHAVLSAPRAVWGNLINFCATVRAIAIYLKSGRERRGRIPWDKTEHEFLD
jgi:adsorption protein B